MDLRPLQAIERGGWHCTPLNPDEAEHPVFDCVLRGARAQAPPRRVIAKCYADAAMGARTFALMRTLSARLDGSGAPGPLRVPRPILYNGASGLLLQEPAEGAPCARLLAREKLHCLRLAGAALAQLHALPAPPAAKGVEQHFAELMRPHPRLLAAALPRARARIEGLMRSLVTAAATDAPVAWVHRDFHVKQLILEGELVWMLDWDLAAGGDPALDVGNFMLNLEKHLPHRAREGRRHFAEGYARAGQACALRRAPLYEALNGLRRACKALRGRRPGWEQDAMGKIDDAERRLQRL